MRSHQAKGKCSIRSEAQISFKVLVSKRNNGLLFLHRLLSRVASLGMVEAHPQDPAL